MSSLLGAIETAAQHPDRSRALVFFLFVARFEYALKRAGFITNSNDAKPNWTEYARRRGRLPSEMTDERLKRALEYLEKFPPKKQIVAAGRLEWSTDAYNGTHDLDRVLTLVRRVRNNIFHGGKFVRGVEPDLSRDRKLLDVCLVILESCVESDHDLRYHFQEGM